MPRHARYRMLPAPAVINEGNAACLSWKQRLNDQPFPVSQFVSPPCHPHSIAMGSLNRGQDSISVFRLDPVQRTGATLPNQCAEVRSSAQAAIWARYALRNTSSRSCSTGGSSKPERSAIRRILLSGSRWASAIRCGRIRSRRSNE